MRFCLRPVARGLASLLVPPACPACGRRVEPTAAPCPDCDRELRRLWDQTAGLPRLPSVVAALPFEGAARALVHRMKYRGEIPACDLLAHLMAARLEGEGPGRAGSLLVPVPLHPVRLRERGFNQAERLARRVGRRLGIPVDAGVLRRRCAAPSQTTRTQQERRRAVAGMYAAARPVAAEATIVLVDDVWTTGATAESCRRALRVAGAAEPVWVLVAARTPARVAD